ncbi:MAG: response regulator [Geopsychrobacter sp.]|nr:response regulator [Geopsychrobacter sp.]
MSQKPTSRILTIDDELLVRRSFRFFLEDLGYQVFEADSGITGLELTTTIRPDLILLDLKMPDIDGLRTLSQLRKDHNEIPVIVISGTGDIHDVVEALRRGACDYLTKPIINLQVLEHAVSKSLERARLLKENRTYQESLETEVKKRTLALEDACRQLAASKQTLEALFQATPLAIVLLDCHLNVTLWNRGAERLFGWLATEVEGATCPLFKDLDEKTLKTIISPGLSSHEQVLENRDQDRLTLRISTAGLDDGPDDDRAIVLLFENITEKKRLQNEADRASRLASLGQLAAGVAHEINNPNGLILLNMPTLRDFIADALDQLNEIQPETRIGGLSLMRAREIAPQLTDEMEDAARRIRQIVEDLKDFASRDSRDTIINFDLNNSVEKALRLANNTIRKATDSFHCDLADSLPQVHGNPQRIEQVIVNLLINACEALEERSASLQLKTCINPAKKMVELQVMDQGSGIKPADMKHITDPFFTTRRETGGTGLGLSVSARIVREHGGRLDFDSKLGQGTCATLGLPIIAEEK